MQMRVIFYPAKETREKCVSEGEIVIFQKHVAITGKSIWGMERRRYKHDAV